MIKKSTSDQQDPQNIDKPSVEVIVKIRSDNASRLAFALDNRPADRSPLRMLMDKGRVASVRPLFPQESYNDLSFGPVDNKRQANAIRMEDDFESELSGLNVVKFKSEKAAAEAVLEIADDPNVEYAHIPAVRRFAAVDPEANRQWGLRAVDYFKAITIPGFRNAEDIKIAIIDSGIDSTHPDLIGSFSDNINFTPLGPDDDSGHGTHVAGIIAAITNNGVGITGTCESKNLMILRGLTSPYYATAYYGALRHALSNGAQVINLSLGGAHDPTEALLIKTAISKGIVVVAAMGNDYMGGNPTSFPAALPDVIAVGASDETDARGAFSQTGSHIHLMAPGVNILSTVPTYPVSSMRLIGYDVLDGTSMATPFVTAAVALMLAKNSTATLTDIKTALASSSVKVGGHTGHTANFGHGRLDLAKAISII